MKTKDIIIIVLSVALIALGIYTYTIYKNQKTVTQMLSGEGESLQIESITKLQDEYLEVMKELEAEDLLNGFQNEGIDEAMTLTELEIELNAIEDYNILDDIKKCRIMKRWLKKQKCKSKRKIYKEVVNKIKIGGVSHDNGKIVINAPQIVRFKNQMTRINVLMETFYSLRASACDSQGFCYTNALLLACVLPDDPDIKKAYLKCAALYTGEIQQRFVQVLTLLFENIEKFQDKQISLEAVKAVVNAELVTISQDLNEVKNENEQNE